MSLAEKAKSLKKNLAAIFLALKNKETPWYAKVVAGITIGYALSPIDLIPDFVPLLGYLDDLIILPLLIALSIKLIPKSIMKQSILEAESLWNGGNPKKWYYAIPIILLWFLILFLLFYYIVIK
jgi:uncharacterized membrane protein YkvA (DUF1232 family)